MHIVTLALERHDATAPSPDADRFAATIMAAASRPVPSPRDGCGRVEHARVVARAEQVDIVLFVLAATVGEARRAAAEICVRALGTAGIEGWAVTVPPRTHHPAPLR